MVVCNAPGTGTPDRGCPTRAPREPMTGEWDVEVTTKGLRLDLDGATWIKSTHSGPGSDNCVEVAFVGDAIAVRDSENPDGPALIFTQAEWDAFVGGAKDGEFDI